MTKILTVRVPDADRAQALADEIVEHYSLIADIDDVEPELKSQEIRLTIETAEGKRGTVYRPDARYDKESAAMEAGALVERTVLHLFGRSQIIDA